VDFVKTFTRACLTASRILSNRTCIYYTIFELSYAPITNEKRLCTLDVRPSVPWASPSCERSVRANGCSIRFGHKSVMTCACRVYLPRRDTVSSSRAPPFVRRTLLGRTVVKSRTLARRVPPKRARKSPSYVIARQRGGPRRRQRQRQSGARDEL